MVIKLTKNKQHYGQIWNLARHPRKLWTLHFCPACVGPEIPSIPCFSKGISRTQFTSRSFVRHRINGLLFFETWKATQHHMRPKAGSLWVCARQILNGKTSMQNTYSKQQQENLDALTLSLFLFSVQSVRNRPLCLLHSCTNGRKSHGACEI